MAGKSTKATAAKRKSKKAPVVNVGADELTNCFLVYGDKSMTPMACQEVAKALFPDGFDERVAYEENYAISDLQACLTTRSIFMSKKLVIVRNPKLEHRNAILSMLVKLSKNKSTGLIIHVDGPLSKSDLGDPLYSFLVKLKRGIECCPVIGEYGKINRDELEKVHDWLKEELDEAHIRLETANSIHKFMQRCGYSVPIIQMELNKLNAYLLNSSKTLSDIELFEVVSDHSEANVFEFLSAMDDLDYGKSAAILDLMLRHSESEAEKIINLLLSRVRLVTLLRSYRTSGVAEGDILEKLREDLSSVYKQDMKECLPHPYVVKIASAVSVRFDMERLASLYAGLFQLQISLRENPEHLGFSLLMRDFMLACCAKQKQMLLS